VGLNSRSPYSYPYNPDANQYAYNTDKNMTVLRFEDANGKPIGMLNWFAVHGTSMNNTNTLISGDNKGFASWYVERMFNPNSVPGTGSFVAAFGQRFVIVVVNTSVIVFGREVEGHGWLVLTCDLFGM